MIASNSTGVNISTFIFSVGFAAHTPTVPTPGPPNPLPLTPDVPVPLPPDPPISVPASDLPAPSANTPDVIPPDILKIPHDIYVHGADSTPILGVILSAIGIGAIVAAVITAVTTAKLEKKRQQSENARKLLELRRLDERQWNGEIREAFTDARKHLAAFRTVVGNTRLAAHWSDNADEMVKAYQQLLAIVDQLTATRDRLRVIAKDELVQTFTAAIDLVQDFVSQFGVIDGQVTYTVETVRSTKVPDHKSVEEAMLESVRTALKTPTTFPTDK